MNLAINPAAGPNTGGWTTILGAEVQYEPSAGNDRGYVSAIDSPGAITWFWEGPPRFRGNMSVYTGTKLTFDLKQSTSSNQFDAADLWLIGSDMELVFNTAHDPGLGWTSYTVPLDGAAGWKRVTPAGLVDASTADIHAVLAGLTNLRIRGEFAGGPDVGGLDNVVFGA